MFGGYAGGAAGGFNVGFEANHQYKKTIFSMRYVGSLKLINQGYSSPFFPFPEYDTKSTAEEFSILYGYRKINNGHSLSFSGGLSRNKFTAYAFNANNKDLRDYYIGFPLEMNIHWFKKEKRRIYIYGLIPVGKPTGLGSSFGFKIYGNISRNSFIGLGINSSFGYLKKY